MSFIETILDELVRLFKQEGIEANSQEAIIKKLDIRQSSFLELFKDRDDMVRKVVLFDLEQRKQIHAVLISKAKNPVEAVMLLLKRGINDTKEINMQYIVELQRHYPDVWNLVVDFLDHYYCPLLIEIINEGIIAGLFRKDINLQLVAKIIFEQLNLILNPAIFPPDRYSFSEVYRSVYLYYMRGLCTEQGGKLAEEFFATSNI